MELLIRGKTDFEVPTNKQKVYFKCHNCESIFREEYGKCENEVKHEPYMSWAYCPHCGAYTSSTGNRSEEIKKVFEQHLLDAMDGKV